MEKGDTVYTRYGEAIITYVCKVTKTCKVKHINYITPITCRVLACSSHSLKQNFKTINKT